MELLKYFLLVIFFLFTNCKRRILIDEKEEIQKIVNTAEITELDTVKKSETNFIQPKLIPTPKKLLDLIKLEISETKTIDFTGDGIDDFLCKVKKNVPNGYIFVEYWINSNYEILRKTDLIYEYDYKWFIDLDGDNKPEIIRAQGESEGINYGLYKIDFSKRNDDLLFYFNPIIKDKDKLYWGYPWEIKNIVIEKDSKLKILASMKHNIFRDGVVLELKGQSKLPVIIFEGNSRHKMMIKDVENIMYYTLKELEKLSTE